MWTNRLFFCIIVNSFDCLVAECLCRKKNKKILLASGASKTLSGVTQFKIGDVCLFGRMYAILYFDPLVLSS